MRRIFNILIAIALLAIPLSLDARRKGAGLMEKHPALAPYFTVPADGPMQPDELGFIRRWLLLEPISKPNRGNTVFVDSYIRENLDTGWNTGDFTLPKDGQKVKVGDARLTWHALDSRLFNVKLYRFAVGTETGRYGIICRAATVIDVPEDLTDVRLAVGQLEELVISLVEKLFPEMNAETLEMMIQGSTAASCRKLYGGIVYTHISRVDYLIALSVLEHSVLMDTRRMRECITPDDGLVRLHRHTHEGGDSMGSLMKMSSLYIGINRDILAALYSHYDLFHGCIAGSFSKSVDSALYLPCSSADTGKRVGSSHSEIIVAVN